MSSDIVKFSDSIQVVRVKVREQARIIEELEESNRELTRIKDQYCAEQAAMEHEHLEEEIKLREQVAGLQRKHDDIQQSLANQIDDLSRKYRRLEKKHTDLRNRSYLRDACFLFIGLIPLAIVERDQLVLFFQALSGP
jgi:hypothetical protein